MEINTAEAKPWWQQGSLHDKTLAEWLIAEQENRMATSLDILVSMQQDMGAKIEYHRGEDLMRYVYEMVGCMDAFASGVPEPDAITVANAALTSAQALGYLEQENDESDATNEFEATIEPSSIDPSGEVELDEVKDDESEDPIGGCH